MRGWCNARVGLLGLAALTLLSLGYAGESKEDEPLVPKTTAALKQAIAAVLQETQTPGGRVVLVAVHSHTATTGRGFGRCCAEPTPLEVLVG